MTKKNKLFEKINMRLKMSGLKIYARSLKWPVLFSRKPAEVI